MITKGKFLLKGHEVVACTDLLEWDKAMEKGKRMVKVDHIDEVRISTVFLGLDHRHGKGEPLLFETMIFGGEHDQYQTRCSTWEQAEAMHLKAKKIVEDLKDE